MLQSLKYARAAAVVRGCSYKLEPGLQAGQLPFVGAAIAQQMNEILETGTCSALEGFRWATARAACCSLLLHASGL